MNETTAPQVQWYAVQTHPNREFVAQSALGALEGVETFLPTLHVQPVNPRARTERPFFPGYLFVCADLGALGRNCIQYRPGVARLVGLGDEPTPIPAAVVAEIGDRIQAAQAQDPLGLGGGATLQPGDKVRIQSGPLAGYEGMFDTRLGGPTRARILVGFMGREMRTDLDVRTLEKVDSGR